MPAMKTVKVSATGPENWMVKTQAGEHTVIIDQPEAMGGENKGPSPLDFVFVALAGCMVTISKMVANQQKIDLRGVEVKIDGDINLAVLRGQEKEDRAGFQNINVEMKIDADLSTEKKKEFIKEVDRRCPVSENLINTTPINVKLVE